MVEGGQLRPARAMGTPGGNAQGAARGGPHGTTASGRARQRRRPRGVRPRAAGPGASGGDPRPATAAAGGGGAVLPGGPTHGTGGRPARLQHRDRLRAPAPGSAPVDSTDWITYTKDSGSSYVLTYLGPDRARAEDAPVPGAVGGGFASWSPDGSRLVYGFDSDD